jgi:carboxypeptidase C (cathepsin A)
MGHLLFIDSPLNVGFSYSGQNRTGRNQVNSTVNASEHLVNFLYNFWNDINFINLRNS